MSIEFRCTHCGKLLRTQAGTEGKQAKCPECGTVLTIPNPPPVAESPALADTIARPFDAPPPREPEFSASAETPQQAADNPYQSPTAYTTPEPVQRGFNPTRIDLSETFSRTWQIYKANLGMCMAGTMLMVVCSMLVGGIAQILTSPIIFQLDGPAFFAGWLFQQVLGQAVSAFFYIGIILFMLRIARGEQAELGLLFGGGPFLILGAALQVTIYLATMAGLILLVIPGIIIALMLSQAMFVLVDQRADFGTALKLSMEAMKGNKLTVLAIWIVGGVLGIVITICTCGIGLLFVLPFMMLLTAVIYLGVTGQATVVDRAAHYAAERSFGTGGMQPT